MIYLPFAPPTYQKLQTSRNVTHLVFAHPLAHIPEPLPNLVALHEARVALVKALERSQQLRLGVEVVQVLAHHREEHGERDPAVRAAVVRGPARVCAATETAASVSWSVGEKLVERGT